MRYHGDVPQTDAGLLEWARPFSTKLSATPVLYGTTASEAASLASLVSDYSTRLGTATDPVTRTKVTLAAKNISKHALTAKCRAIARTVKAFSGITIPLLEELGLHARDREPTPINPPATCPVVSVERVGGMQGAVRIVDILTPSSRAKPDGVTGAYLYVKVDGEPPTSTEECIFVGAATRNSHIINFPPGSAGKTFYLMSRWVNPRLQAGPPSGVVSGTIAA